VNRNQKSREAARRVAQALRADACPTDTAFDRFLPLDLRDVSEQYWTSLRVVKRAAEWLAELRIRTVVDIGSGAGKFCVAGALLTDARFIGLEHRRSLVESAQALAKAFGVSRRVTFVHGALGAVPTPRAEAYYLFNPFCEYWLDSRRDDRDPDVTFTHARRKDDIAAVERLIRLSPIGTTVLTYNGFGGRMPDCCDLLHLEWTLPGALRLWRKQRDTANTRTGTEESVRG
jgi:hypothetical protein